MCLFELNGLKNTAKVQKNIDICKYSVKLDQKGSHYRVPVVNRSCKRKCSFREHSVQLLNEKCSAIEQGCSTSEQKCSTIERKCSIIEPPYPYI